MTSPSVSFLISSATTSAASTLRQSITTLAPLLLMSRAVNLPMPVLHPVIATILPSSLALLLHCAPYIQFQDTAMVDRNRFVKPA